MTDVEREFERAMVHIYTDAKRDAGYNATRFLQMITDSGGLATARQLLRAPGVSDGFTALYLAGRLDLTVEAHVLDSRFAELFTDAERRIARSRLADHGRATAP